jgi:two-component sensor histidine kinase
MIESSESAVKTTDRSLLYVAELVHRVQNDYTTAISFASTMVTRSRNPEAKAALREVIDHLYALAKAHRVLRPPSPGGLVDFAADLTQLCGAISSAGLARRGLTLNLTVSGSVLLESTQCWRANLILSEVISNASRHAFITRGSRIGVDVTIASGWILCRVSDDGSSAPTPEPGLGTQLVDALAADLGGQVSRRHTESGTVVTLTFPTNSDQRSVI